MKNPETPCGHKHTHPDACDDCGHPWCGVCATYHYGGRDYGHQCASALRARIATLESALRDVEKLADCRDDRAVMIDALDMISARAQGALAQPVGGGS